MTETETLDETTTEPGEPDETDADLGPAEHDDDLDPDDDPEPLSEPDEPSAQALAADFEAKLKKLSASATTWRNRVSAVLEDDAQYLVACELCDPAIPGFHWPAEIDRPRDETHLRLLEVLKTPAAPEYVPDPGHTRCGACEGYGKVRTGSRVPGQEVGTCGNCRGFGFVPPPGVNVATGEVAQTFNGSPPPPDDFGPPADTDAFGSPRVLPDGQLNPNYGRMPQYKDASLP